MKFGTAHGRSIPDVGSAKCMTPMEVEGFPGPPVFLVNLSEMLSPLQTF